jgi:hypothetical protein
VSCHEIDLELSAAVRTPAPLACNNIALIFNKSISNSQLISRY